MHMSLFARFANPSERAVSKMNFQAIPLKQLGPKNTDLLALSDAIRRNESGTTRRALDRSGHDDGDHDHHDS